jgi:hypothetical protein
MFEIINIVVDDFRGDFGPGLDIRVTVGEELIKLCQVIAIRGDRVIRVPVFLSKEYEEVL